jgi:hypothetical protein
MWLVMEESMRHAACLWGKARFTIPIHVAERTLKVRMNLRIARRCELRLY